MFLDTPGCGIETECPFRQWDADCPGREPPGEKVAHIVTGNLHKEDGVWSLRCTVMAHLRQESSRDNKQDGEKKIAKGDGGQSRIVCEADQLADLEGKCCDLWILFCFLLDGGCFADRLDFLRIIQRCCRCRDCFGFITGGWEGAGRVVSAMAGFSFPIENGQTAHFDRLST